MILYVTHLYCLEIIVFNTYRHYIFFLRQGHYKNEGNIFFNIELFFLYFHTVMEQGQSSTQAERHIILIGNLGAGKSYCGNKILGKTRFESKCSWSVVTRHCKYDSAIRNGFNYHVFDTPGMNLTEKMKKDIDVKTDIRRSLYGLYPGYHAIILVLSATEMITDELFKLLGDLLEENAYKYMIIIISKIENDENKLNEITKDSQTFKNLENKCNKRVVIFGNHPEKTPDECVKQFDDILTNLIMENSKLGKEYYTHKYSKWVKDMLKKDEEDFLRKNPTVEKQEASNIVKTKAAEGLSPRDKELKRRISRSCCIS